jgi:hypothetical protein
MEKIVMSDNAQKGNLPGIARVNSNYRFANANSVASGPFPWDFIAWPSMTKAIVNGTHPALSRFTFLSREIPV